MSFTNGFDGPQLSPQITLRKGSVEIKVQNAAAVIKRINELVPGSTYEHCKNSKIADVRNSWQTTAKDWFKKEMFGDDEEDFDIIVSDAEPAPSPNFPLPGNLEPHLVQSVNKNAYEIRSDVLQKALEWIRWQTDTQLSVADRKGTVLSLSSSVPTSDQVLDIAKKFYAFVENRR
jgi:hypothetical protein